MGHLGDLNGRITLTDAPIGDPWNLEGEDDMEQAEQFNGETIRVAPAE
jgi:hypothetical protein